VEEAMSAISEAEAGAMIFLGVAGGTREVVLDKRCGDCGMTCARATHATRGVLLKRIAKGSLADAAKLYPGDTILSINGKLINHHQVAVDEIDACEDVVRLVLLGESTELHLPASLPSDPSAPLGITLANHEDVSDGAGVRVVSVVPEGRAAAAGVTAGDTLLSVDGVLCVDHVQALGMLETQMSGPDPTNPFLPIKAQPKASVVVVQSKYSARR
jgi:S1-C subfamily serine protease